MDTHDIVDVSEADFQYEVLQYSHKTPVVVDFWADWCVPCKSLGPILEALAEDYAGEFRLARVDVDENPKLAMQYNVRSIPAVKGFRRGMVVSEFNGVIPKPEVVRFLRELTPSKADLLQAKGDSLLGVQDWAGAEACFRAVLKKDQGHTGARLGLAKASLGLNKFQLAEEILQNFPASKEFSSAAILQPLPQILERTERDPVDDPIEATFERALQLFKAGQYPAALDGLIETIRMDKNFRRGEPRLVVLGILELLGAENPTSRQYRSELASVLF